MSAAQHAAPVVHVAGDDAAVGRAQVGYVGGGEQAGDLPVALGGREAQVHVEDVEVDRLRPARNVKTRVLGSAAFAPRHGQIDVPLAADREVREGGVAVAALLEHHVHAHRAIAIAQLAGQQRRQVEMVRARRAAIDLLQQHDVGVVMPEDLDDPLRGELAVHADRLVDVVCQQAHAHCSMLFRRAERVPLTRNVDASSDP